MESKTIRVLLVEDDQTDRRIVERILCPCLKPVQFALSSAENLAEALESLNDKTKEFDVLLLDLDLRPRFADGNCDGNSIVDMGAYEFSYAYAGDFDGDCNVDFSDFAILANSWLQNNPSVDIAPPPAGDGIVDIEDLAVLCDNWLAGK